MGEKTSKILVVGAGISGIRSALDLALMGYNVALIDKAAYTGGTVVRLDHQFPSDACGICRMLPLAERDDQSQHCMRRGVVHENIEVLRSTELVALEGEPGRFTAILRSKPTMVDRERCIGCGRCADVCPVQVPADLNAGLAMHKAIYLPLPYDLPNNYVVDLDACTRCGECQIACPTNAIDLGMNAREQEINVGAVIMAAGFGMFDPASGNDTYCYDHPNVVTSLEFEHLMSRGGPNQGQLLRPGDGKPIDKVAWLQCVGSRDRQVNGDFCSSACCMYSIKQAVLAKESAGGLLDAAIFYMDMRTYGKNFQTYRDRAEKEQGVRFKRSRIHSVIPVSPKGALRLSYVEDHGGMTEETFDLIVLAAGQRPSPDAKSLAEIAKIELNPWGFLKPQTFSLTKSGREGIFASGSFSGLRDISESVIAANSASLAASNFLASMTPSTSGMKDPAAVRMDRSLTIPRVFVAICTCSDALQEAVELDDLAARIADLDSVGRVQVFGNLSTRGGWRELEEALAPSKCNRLLLCSCMPSLFAVRLRKFAHGLGFDRDLVEVVDLGLRSLPEAKQKKLRIQQDLLARIAVGARKLKTARVRAMPSTGIEARALVIGGGIAGMTAALAIANHGFPVDLVERSAELGGNLRDRYCTLDGGSPQKLLADTISKIENHQNIRIHKKARTIRSEGRLGRFATTLMKEDGTVETISHGVTILATGGKEARTESYCYGRSSRITTQGELERKINDGAINPEDLTSVAMIQCVDSREVNRNYCSRICCASALKNALFLKERNPDVQVYVFYRDFMSYGFMETYYTLARKAGIVFIPYQPDGKPDVIVEDDIPVVSALDPILHRELQLRPDLLVLSTGLIPDDSSEELAETLCLELDESGFYQEEESKWRPVDLSRRGIFACGICHSPRNITETVAMAESAALRSLRFLFKTRLSTGTSTLAYINKDLCAGCKTCVNLCAFHSISFDEGRKLPSVDEMLCQGCGVCAAACPTGSINVGNYSSDQMLGQIEDLLAV
jgi:heterodisulfide reductase subunit A